MNWTTHKNDSQDYKLWQLIKLSRLPLILVFCLCFNLAFSQSSIAYLRTDLEITPSTFLADRGEHIIPFELVRGMIVMQAKIDQQPGHFILDTGAPLMVINDEPEIPSRIAASFKQEIEVGETIINYFDWAGTEEKQLNALVLDISHLEQAFQRPLTGMIGFNALKDYELFFDYEKQIVLRYNAHKNPLHKSVKPLHRLPFQKFDHLPVLTVKIGNKKFRFGLDTGACANLVDPSVLNALKSESFRRLPDEEIQGLDQSVNRVKAVQVTSVKIKDLVVGDLKFLATDMPELRSDEGVALDGLLGYSFLSQMKFSINYPKQQIYVWEESSKE